jgi:sporulation protein YlmC with PRC-barrel domain
MGILISELYGKQIITNTGKKLGSVEDIVVDVEVGGVSNLLLTKSDNLIRSKDTRGTFSKNNVKFERVKSIAEIVVVGLEKQ